MQLILTALESLVFRSIFPKQDSMIHMLIKKELAKRTQLTAEELNALNLLMSDNKVKGDEKRDFRRLANFFII
jgi:hypothetical protein